MMKKTLLAIMLTAFAVATPATAATKVIVVFIQQNREVEALMSEPLSDFSNAVMAGIAEERISLVRVQGRPYVVSNKGTITVEEYDSYSLLVTFDRRVKAGDFLCFASEIPLVQDPRRSVNGEDLCGQIPNVRRGLTTFMFIVP